MFIAGIVSLSGIWSTGAESSLLSDQRSTPKPPRLDFRLILFFTFFAAGSELQWWGRRRDPCSILKDFWFVELNKNSSMLTSIHQTYISTCRLLLVILCDRLKFFRKTNWSGKKSSQEHQFIRPTSQLVNCHL